MAKLIKLQTWVYRNFETEEMPNIRTFQRMAANGRIKGASKIGQQWFIDPEFDITSGRATQSIASQKPPADLAEFLGM